MAIRTIETLAKQFPDKTGKELFEIQENDKRLEQKRIDNEFKELFEFINDLNTNGAYYKGTFGLNQYFLYKFTNIKFDKESKRTYCDVENITCFKHDDGSVDLERKKDTFKDISKYGIEYYERVTKEEFDEVSKYLNDIFPKFWKLIDPNS